MAEATGLTRRDILRGFPAFLQDVETGTPSRSFWIFGLLSPHRLEIAPVRNGRLHCESAEGNYIVEAGCHATVGVSSTPLRIAGPDGQAVPITLRVPGKIERTYFGVVRVFRSGGLLVPTVRTEGEVATGSIVAAELPVQSAPWHALAAQAVVSRSILLALARPRHDFADFCDTTHCQFLRSPVSRESATGQAVMRTAGWVLRQQGRILSARYCGACGGVTESGLRDGQEYVAVPCVACRDRRLTRRGHGWGMCQEGAIGLARRGCTWRQILSAYYPNAEVKEVGYVSASKTFADPAY